MDVEALYELLGLFTRTMDGHGLLWLVVVTALWAPVLVLTHELGHAGAALRLTSGPVLIGGPGKAEGWVLEGDRLQMQLAAGVFFGGRCDYDPQTLLRPRAEAWIAAAGPAVSLLASLVLAVLALVTSGGIAAVLVLGAAGSGSAFLFSALPITHDLGMGTHDSDGRVIWRVLRGSPPGRDHVWDDAVAARPDRIASPVALVALAVCFCLALFLSPGLAFALVALVGSAAVLQRLG